MNAFLHRIRTLLSIQINPEIIFICAAVCALVGSIIIVADLTWCAFPEKFDNRNYTPTGNLELGFWILAAAGVMGIFIVKELSATEPSPADLRYSNIMFGRALVGIGFFLLLDALLNVVAISGFASHGTDKYIFRPNMLVPMPLAGQSNSTASASQPVAIDSKNTTPLPKENGNIPIPTTPKETNAVTAIKQPAIDQLEPRQKNFITAIQLICALGFTLMGALFFFAKSLWEKMQSPTPVQYDHRIFWAGLWFRLGEAIVFTVAVFVALLFRQHSDAAAWMPLIALVIGLSVKATENLIAGICERLLASVNGLINK